MARLYQIGLQRPDGFDQDQRSPGANPNEASTTDGLPTNSQTNGKHL